MHIHDIEKQLKSTLKRKALGYESSLDFAYGYLLALKTHKIITPKEYTALTMVYASPDNSECDFYITEDGELGRYPTEEE